MKTDYTLGSLTPLSVQPIASPNTVTTGSPVTFTPSQYGDIPPYTYKWAFEVDTLWDGLVHAWSLDEPSGTRYACFGSKNLTEVGTVGTAAGAYGDAADFASGYLHISVGPLVTTDFTISLWFKCTSDLILLSQDAQLLIGVLSGRFYAEVKGWAVDQATWPVGLVNDGVWHHALVWVDTATDMSVHSSIDGGALTDASIALSGTLVPAANELIVGYVDLTPVLFMQRVAWWNRALTAGEKTALYTGQFYGSGLDVPTYAYPTSGAKVASLTVTSAHGCEAGRSIGVVVT